MAKAPMGSPRPSTGYGVDDYGYINARVRAMKVNLLNKADLERMLRAEKLEVLYTMLASTEYGPDIKASEQKFVKGMNQLTVMEDGLKQNFIHSMLKICSFVSGRSAELVGIVLGHWDIYNIKTLFRGKYSELPSAQIIQSLFPVGTFEQDSLEKLARKKDAKEIFETLALSYPQMMLPIKTDFEEYQRVGNLAKFELSMDKMYFQNARNICAHEGSGAHLVDQYLRVEIDIVNLLTCFRLARIDMKTDEALQYYIPGGKNLKPNEFTNLMSKADAEAIISWIKHNIPVVKDDLDQKQAFLGKGNDVGLIERLLETCLLRMGQRFTDPLGFNVLMTYLKLKYNEMINLRIIIRTVEFGIPLEIANRELILV